MGLVKNEDKKALKAVKVVISNLVHIFNSDTVALTGRTVTRFPPTDSIGEEKSQKKSFKLPGVALKIVETPLNSFN